MPGYGLRNRLAQSNALVSHKTSPNRTTSWMMGGISDAHNLAGYKPIASAGGEWRRGYEVGQSGAWALTGYTALELTSSRPMGVSTRHQNPQLVMDS
ncbi:unnamed protein product [Sphagnum balticum]